jgi:hypothetical protein
MKPFPECDGFVKLEYPPNVRLCVSCMDVFDDCYETDSEDDSHVASMPYSTNRMLLDIRKGRETLWRATETWFQETRPCRWYNYWAAKGCENSVDGDWGKYCWYHVCRRKGCTHERSEIVDDDGLCYNCTEIVRLGEILEVEYKTEEEFHQEIQDRKRKRVDADPDPDSASASTSPDEKRVCVETADQ